MPCWNVKTNGETYLLRFGDVNAGLTCYFAGVQRWAWNLHVVLAFLLVEFAFLLSGGILVLLVLGDLIQNQDFGQRKIIGAKILGFSISLDSNFGVSNFGTNFSILGVVIQFFPSHLAWKCTFFRIFFRTKSFMLDSASCFFFLKSRNDKKIEKTKSLVAKRKT